MSTGTKRTQRGVSKNTKPKVTPPNAQAETKQPEIHNLPPETVNLLVQGMMNDVFCSGIMKTYRTAAGMEGNWRIMANFALMKVENPEEDV